MKNNSRHHRADLKTVARRAMVDRDLLPDFAASVLAEVNEIRGAAG